MIVLQDMSQNLGAVRTFRVDTFNAEVKLVRGDAQAMAKAIDRRDFGIFNSHCWVCHSVVFDNIIKHVSCCHVVDNIIKHMPDVGVVMCHRRVVRLIILSNTSIHIFHLIILSNHSLVDVCLCFTALLIWDTPYGIGHEEWDTAPLTEEEIKSVLTQFKAVNSRDSFHLFFWVHWNQLALYSDCLSNAGYSSITPVCWYKNDQNVVGPPGNWTHAFEIGIHAVYRGSSGNALINYMSANPLERHNIIIGPNLHKYYIHDDTKRVNAHQKPDYLMQNICTKFCRPGEHVVVLGAGAGGEVRGALRAGCSVFAMEKDQRQFTWLCQHLLTLDTILAQEIEAEKKKRAAQGLGDDDDEEDGDSSGQPSCPSCGCSVDQQLQDCPECESKSCSKCCTSFRSVPGASFCSNECYEKAKKKARRCPVRILFFIFPFQKRQDCSKIAHQKVQKVGFRAFFQF